MQYHVQQTRLPGDHTAKVHRGDCACVTGRAAESAAGEGRWHGPFASLREALQAAELTRGCIHLCRKCMEEEAIAREAGFVEWATRRQAAHEAMLSAIARLQPSDQATLLRRLRMAHTLPRWYGHYEDAAEEIAGILLLLSYPPE